MDNTINYAKPVLSGFLGQIGYGLGEQAGDNSALRKLSALGTYSSGAINAVLAYHNVNNAATAGGSNKTTLIGGTYDFGVAKAHAAYAWNKGDTTAATVLDSRDMMIGVSAPVGQGSVLASYVRKNNKLTSNSDANQLALGYTYALSKRTDLYTSIARIANDSNSTINYYGTTAKGNTHNLFDFGIRHKF